MNLPPAAPEAVLFRLPSKLGLASWERPVGRWNSSPSLLREWSLASLKADLGDLVSSSLIGEAACSPTLTWTRSLYLNGT